MTKDINWSKQTSVIPSMRPRPLCPKRKCDAADFVEPTNEALNI